MPAAVLGAHAAWVSGGSTVSINSNKIFVRQQGPSGGSPVTLLHGFPSSSHDWAPVVERLAATGYRVTTLDFLGFGASAKPHPHPYRLVEQADVVEQLWTRLGIERTALVAHDYGVSVAQELLARDPARMPAVAYLNGGVYPDLHRPIPIQRLLHGRLGPLLGRLSSERTFRVAMRKIMAAPVADADLHAMWTAVTLDHGTRVQHELLHYIDERKLHARRWVDAMEAYPGRSQFVWGPLDPISGSHVLQRLRERIPQASFVELPGIGHYPQVEAPSAVADALGQFLASGEYE